MKKLRIGLGLLTASLFVYFLLYRIDFGKLFAAFSAVRLEWLALGVVCLLAGYGVRTIRWWLMLRVVGSRAGLASCAWPFLSSFGLNNVLPLRAGDAYRAFGFSARLDCPPWQVLGTLAMERVLDLLTLLLIFLAATSMVPDHIVSRALLSSFQAVIALGVAAVVGVMLVPRRLVRLLDGAQVRDLTARTRVTEAVRTRAAEVLGAIVALCRVRTLPALLLLSLLAWTFEGLVFVCVAAGLGAPDLLRGPILGFTMGTLSTLLPSTPGYFGTFDYFAMRGLEMTGTEADLAAANALLSHLVIWAPVTVMTIGYFLFNPSFWPSRSRDGALRS